MIREKEKRNGMRANLFIYFIGGPPPLRTKRALCCRGQPWQAVSPSRPISNTEGGISAPAPSNSVESDHEPSRWPSTPGNPT